jgi:hypothetical protein
MALTRIHVNQHVIRANAKSGECNPVFTVKCRSKNTYANEVFINSPCRLVYYPDNPLSCGARVWIEVFEESGVVIHSALDKEATI